MSDAISGLLFLGCICVVVYLVFAGAYLVVSPAATKCRAMGGQPVTNLFHISNVSCLEQRFIPLPKS